MAQVPYQPIPTVGPSQQGIAGPRVDAPLAAFGGATGAAMSTLGKTIEGAGNELFTRAIAIQQLNNETEAREADAQYMIKAGELHANYNALQGKDRVDAFPKYSQDLQSLRTNIRNGLSNPMAQKLYDASSLSTMGRSIFNGAGAAAAANKEWTINTTKAQLDIDAKTIEDDPSEGNFQAKLGRIQNSARSLAAQQGLGVNSPQEQDLVMKATSKAWSQRIIGLSRTAPFEAAKMLDDNKTQFTSDDYLKVDQTVRAQGRAVGAARIADAAYSPNKTLAEMEGEVKAAAEKQSPDDPLLAQHAITNLRTRYNQDHYASRQEALSARDDAFDMIRKFKPQNLQQFLAIPGADGLYQRMNDTQKNALPGQISRYVGSVDRYDNEKEFTRLHGMATSDDPDARAEFLNTDVTQSKLSQPQIDRLQTIQNRMKTNTEGDPRVNRAVTWLRGAMGAQLEALGVYKRTESNKEDYDHFIGALQSGLDVWNEQHKSPPTYKDVVETIGPQILRQRTEPGFFSIYGYGMSSQKPFFTQTVPEEFAARARAVAGNPNLPDEQIYKLWTRMQYRQLYSKPPSKTEDRAPQ